MEAFAISKTFLLYQVFAKFSDSYFKSFQTRSMTRYQDFRTRVNRQKENNLVSANKRNQFLNIYMTPKKSEVKPAASYFTISEDPIEVARERIETLPESIAHMITELRLFCVNLDEEYLDCVKHLI